MGQQHSMINDPSIYNQVNTQNLEGIIRQLDDIERIDRDGRTPLIFACLKPEMYMVAKTLIELGANVNAYRTGPHSGTPLHHAAKKGLHRTAKLLLSNGADTFIMDDNSQTPLDVARTLKHSNVVRTIENHICLFSGWMRDFSESVSAELLISKKVWIVISPSPNLSITSPNSLGLELSMYLSLQNARPRLILSLAKANMVEPNFHQRDPTVVLTHVPTNEKLKLGSAKVGDWQQLEWFCNSCKGIPTAMHPPLSNIYQVPNVPASAPPVPRDFEVSRPTNNIHSYPKSSIYDDGSTCNRTFDEAGPSNLPNDSEITDLYPPIRTSSTQAVIGDDVNNKKTEDSSCVICENAAVEGACVPCGHMAGCMKCLQKIKMLNLGCPICRSKIDQVVKLFAV